eukprot:scaffold7382_cov41-Prasinocladus_malaysianus.AAC.3
MKGGTELSFEAEIGLVHGSMLSIGLRGGGPAAVDVWLPQVRPGGRPPAAARDRAEHEGQGADDGAVPL